MIQIFIANNDGVHDLFATVTDLNTAQPTTPMVNQRINRGANAPVNVQEDGNGNCLVNVVTVNADPPNNSKSFDNQVTMAGGTISVDVF